MVLTPTTISRTFLGINKHEFRNIYMRHRFRNADVINKIRTFAGVMVLKAEGT